eukprot:GEMP01119707.1.p1 GENE.GEMP01119707.1~~GEMP01119707.1.p1  ORF type:complete len:181 (+),score=42.75 GEMP01119707.1:59-601(+)
MVASGRTAQQSARWPPGPAKVDAKKLDLMSIRTFEDLHDRYGDIFILPLGETPLVVTRHPEHIRQLLVEMGDTHQFPRPPNVIANVKTLFGEALIATDGKLHKERRQHLNPHFFEPEKLRISWENSRPFIERYVSSMHDLSLRYTVRDANKNSSANSNTAMANRKKDGLIASHISSTKVP